MACMQNDILQGSGVVAEGQVSPVARDAFGFRCPLAFFALDAPGEHLLIGPSCREGIPITPGDECEPFALLKRCP